MLADEAQQTTDPAQTDPGGSHIAVDVAPGQQPGAPVLEGLPDDSTGPGSRAQSEHASAAQAQVAPAVQAVAYEAMEVSSTTDPHHDQGSGATGHVEDATPDTRAAGPAEEEKPEEPPPPPPEEPPKHDDPAPVTPEPTTAEAHHDDPSTTAPEA